MNRDARSAADLLEHYLRRAWQAAGLDWTQDNSTEVRNIVDLTIAATIEEVEYNAAEEARMQQSRRMEFGEQESQ